MKITSLICILLFIASPTHADELIERTALNGKLSLMIPARFSPMPRHLLELKYPSSKRPAEVLSDETGGVSIAFNHTPVKMSPAQVKEAHAAMSKMFHNMYPSAKWIRDETKNIKGRPFMVFELVTPAMDTKIHNIMYGTSVDNRFLLVSFNTTVEQAGQWLPIGKRMMDSISIK